MEEHFICVQHVNDLALDCRAENLKMDTSTIGNVRDVHRLKREPGRVLTWARVAQPVVLLTMGRGV